MAQQEFCENCNQQHDCQEVYRQLGDTTGPSVVFKVIVAFGLPLIVFIVSLAVSKGIFAEVTNTKGLQTALSFFTALLTTFVCILITGVINKRLGQAG